MSNVTETIRARLVRDYNVQAVPDIFLTGGISPNVVLSGIDSPYPVFNQSQLKSGIQTAPLVNTAIVTSDAFNAGCVDVTAFAMTDDTTPRLVFLQWIDAAGTSKRAWQFILSATLGMPWFIVSLEVAAGDKIRFFTGESFTAAKRVTGNLGYRQRLC